MTSHFTKGEQEVCKDTDFNPKTYFQFSQMHHEELKYIFQIQSWEAKATV